MSHQTITLVTPDDTASENPIWTASPPFSRWIDQLALTGGSAGTWTVPTGFDMVIITYTAGKLYGSTIGGTAVLPAAAISDGTGSEEIINGSSRRVFGGQTISMINATTCKVSLSLYKRLGGG